MEFFFLRVGTPDRFQKQKSPEQDSVNESGGGHDEKRMCECCYVNNRNTSNPSFMNAGMSSGSMSFSAR